MRGRGPRSAWSWAARSAAMTLLLLEGCGGMPSDPPATAQAAAVGMARPAVTLPLAPLKLLPFDARLQRVAAAVDVPVNDRVFDVAREQRLALGAHDFINGVVPDLQWNSQRMAAWVTVMLPVCRDSRVRSKLGDWKQGGLEKFAQGAFGRAATAEDLSDLTAALALTGDDGWVGTCLSLLSSAEVVLQ